MRFCLPGPSTLRHRLVLGIVLAAASGGLAAGLPMLWLLNNWPAAANATGLLLASALPLLLAAAVAGLLAWRATRGLDTLHRAARQKLQAMASTPQTEPGGPKDLADIVLALECMQDFSIRQRKELEAVLDHANVALVLFRDGRIEIVNRQACVDTGYTREQLIGMMARDMHPSDEAFEAFARAVVPSLTQHGQADIEVPVKRRDGSLFWGRLMGRAVVPGDPSAGHIWVMVDVTREREQRSQLQWAASHDRMTGLVNSAAFTAQLDEHCRHAASEPFCLLFIDLDRFKAVNDTGGHAAGDALLRGLVDDLRQLLRKTDVMARLGGDEFAVILPGCAAEQAEALAERLRRAVETYRLDWDGQSFSVGASIGLAVARGEHSDGAELLRQADAACYRAKRGGRNQVVSDLAQPA